MTEPKQPNIDEREKLSKLRSYWYPDRSVDMQEVGVGYHNWNESGRIVILGLIPIMIVVIGMFVMSLKHSNEFMEMYSHISAEIAAQAT
jgi:hypothetical protein